METKSATAMPAQALESSKIAVDTILMLTQESRALRDSLRDLLAFYDKLDGHAGELGCGWTWEELNRLEEIRALAARPPAEAPRAEEGDT